MNVAVGGTNGWFPDGAGDKPWLDGSFSEYLFFFLSQVLRIKLIIFPAAMYDFAMAQDEWYASWPVDRKERAMAM